MIKPFLLLGFVWGTVAVVMRDNLAAWLRDVFST